MFSIEKKICLNLKTFAPVKIRVIGNRYEIIPKD